jgi:serine phosphatase RsbU (regulator of sigma subunit)
MQKFGIKAKLILLFILIKVLPLVLVLYIAIINITSIKEFFIQDATNNIKNNITLLNSTLEDATKTSIQALDKSSQKSYEKLTVSIANSIADFLYHRDKDLLYLSTQNLSNKFLEDFYNAKRKKIVINPEYVYDDKKSKWVLKNQLENNQDNQININPIKDNEKDFNFITPRVINTKSIPIYKELSFFDLNGKEKYKKSEINQKLLDISKQENTYIKAEDYFTKIQDLKKGEIYVSNVIGEYVGTRVIGTFNKAKAEKMKVLFQPQNHAYAGKENPKGKRFEGIIRFVTPVYKNNKKIGYISIALNHRHVMEYTDTIDATSAHIRQDISDAGNGNYAFMWDNVGRCISHPRDYFIPGFDANTGQRVTPWLSADIAQSFKDSKQDDIRKFLDNYPTYEEQSSKKKPNISQLLKDGQVGLDCRYLNFAPQCTGWDKIAQTGGHGSFVIFWSKVWKLTTVSAIPYYTGQYGNTKRGFGIVTIGANLDEFHKAAVQTKEKLDQIVKKEEESLQYKIQETIRKIENSLNNTMKDLTFSTLLLTILVIALAVMISNYITKKIYNLIFATKELSQGNFDIKLDISSKDELGVLTSSFQDTVDKMKILVDEKNRHNEILEEEVQRQTKELVESHKEVNDSIIYASKMQASLLPKNKVLNEVFSENFIIWLPRNKVSGDIYICEKSSAGTLIGVIDCTGHGVPGAFMTMLALSTIKSFKDENIFQNPAMVLNRLNETIKMELKQNRKDDKSDDGLDIGLCFIDNDKTKMTFSGAKIDLVYFEENEFKVIKSNRQSIGYNKSKLDYEYTNYTLDINNKQNFYLYSDGIIDQVGELKPYPFGKKRFHKELAVNQKYNFATQKVNIIKALDKYQGEAFRRDDITILGFKVK